MEILLGLSHPLYATPRPRTIFASSSVLAEHFPPNAFDRIGHSPQETLPSIGQLQPSPSPTTELQQATDSLRESVADLARLVDTLCRPSSPTIGVSLRPTALPVYLPKAETQYFIRRLQAAVDHHLAGKSSNGFIANTHGYVYLKLSDASTLIDPAQIKNLVGDAQSLTHLEVHAASDLTDDHFNNITAFKNLRGFDMKNCPQVTAKGIAALAPLEHLTTLRVPDIILSPDTGSAVAKLTHLRRLTIALNEDGSSEGLSHLAAMPHLRSLTLHGEAALSKADIDQLTKFEALQFLDISSVKQAIPEQVQALKQALPNCTICDHVGCSSCAPKSTTAQAAAAA